MKRILRTYLCYAVALWLTKTILNSSFNISGNIQIWAFAALVLALLNTLLKPILTLLFLPIHVLTLGIFSVVVNAGVFYIFLRVVPQATITPWSFQGISLQGIVIPNIDLPIIGTIFVASILISLITNFLGYLVE